ncbi:immunoglobulin domain-containing protein [Candidatus Sumerlaeota bacterium]|nr:immunoglobulin domain-containing protein [Candidatus Sumerlaeota bacterium]
MILFFPVLAFSGGEAQRSFSLVCYNSSESFTIFIDVVPEQGTKSWACDDQPPSGWIVSNISDGGVWDNNFRKVKWFFMNDDAPRLLSYDILPPKIASGTVVFSGRASFDGPTIVTGGESSLDCRPPSIISNPVSVSADYGDSVLFSVAAMGNGVLSYQWIKNNGSLSDSMNISGSNTNSLRIDPVEFSDAGNYQCEVSDVCGLTLSTVAALTLKTQPSMTESPPSNTLYSESADPEATTVKAKETPEDEDQMVSKSVNKAEISESSPVENTPSPTIEEPVFNIAPSGDYDFRFVAVGKSKSVSWTIENSGGGVLSGYASSDNPRFFVQNPSSYHLPRYEKAAIGVCFKPDRDGFSSATLTFTGVQETGILISGYGYYPHCADLDGDMKIGADEVTLYASEWKRGKRDCVDCVKHGASIYLKSEKYKIVGKQDAESTKNCRDSIIAPEME